MTSVDRDLLSRENWRKLTAISAKVHSREQQRAPVDVVIAVQGDLERALRSVQSVLRSNAASNAIVYLIDDVKRDSKMRQALAELEDEGVFVSVESWDGYWAARGERKSSGEHKARAAVILESGTEVHEDWLDRLIAASGSGPSVGTVKPLANDGSLSSYPIAEQVFDRVDQLKPSNIDNLASTVNSGQWFEAPYGYGACLYLVGSCFDAVASMDPELLPRDRRAQIHFSARASELGWRHVIAADVFVSNSHAGEPFPECEVLNSRSEPEELFAPDGDHAAVESFRASDPLRGAREALDCARFTSSGDGPAVLLVNHRLGGGTRRHVADLAQLLEADGARALVCMPARGASTTAVISHPRSTAFPNLPSLLLRSAPGEAAETLQTLGITHIHVHNLVGFDGLAPDFFRLVSAELEVPLDVTVHDYQSFCPRVHLAGITGKYCGEPPVKSCERCVDTLGSRFGRSPVWEWRERNARLLASARKIFAPTRDVSDRIVRHFPDVTPTVREHPEANQRQGWAAPGTPVIVPPSRQFERRVAIVGSIGAHKGSGLIYETAQALCDIDTELELVVVGITDRDDLLEKSENVRVLGAYQDDTLVMTLGSLDLSAVWFASVVPETFSYTLSAVMTARLPVVTFDFGAVAERASSWPATLLMPTTDMFDPQAIARHLSAASRQLPPLIQQSHVYWRPQIYESITRDYYELTQ